MIVLFWKYRLQQRMKQWISPPCFFSESLFIVLYRKRDAWKNIIDLQVLNHYRSTAFMAICPECMAYCHETPGRTHL